MTGAAPFGRRWATALGCVALAAAACRPPDRALRLVIAYPHGALDLVSHRTNDEISNAILRHAYEPLVDYAADLSLVPCLADTWYNPDELTWVFRLREGVMRHDGHPLTAADVAGYFDAAAADPAAVRGATDVERVEAVSGSQVVFHTRRPIGWLPSLLARQLVSLPPSRPGEPPVGTGPWRVVEWTPDGDTVMEAFDEYRGGPPSVRRLEFRALDPSTAVERLRRGEVHLMIDVPGAEWRALRGAPAVETHAQPGLRVYYLVFQLLGDRGRRPVGDRRVREAVARAVDRGGLLEGDLLGTGEPIRTLVPPAVFGHNPEALAPERDLARARRLLAEAGYPRGLRLSLAVGRQAASAELARALRTQLAEVGIELELDEAPPPDGQGVPATDMFLLGWLHSSGDAGASSEYLLHSPGSGAMGSVSGFSDPEVDRLIAEASLPLTMPERHERLLAIAARVSSEIALVPLYRQVDLYAWARPLRVTPRLDRRLRVWEMAWGPDPPASAVLEGRP